MIFVIRAHPEVKTTVLCICLKWKFSHLDFPDVAGINRYMLHWFSFKGIKVEFSIYLFVILGNIGVYWRQTKVIPSFQRLDWQC